jgi:undecaprenyl-diphosphatase
MATLAVSLFVLVAYTVIIGADPGPTPGDETAIELVGHIQTSALTSVAKVLSFLGFGPFAWGLALVCGALLAWRRRWTEFWVLLAGMTITLLGIVGLKDAVDRPPDPLVSGPASSFPSGHAAHSVIYLWLAVTVVLRLRPGMARATAVVVTGFVLTALVGLSRVYLGVHYLSDVNAGWALGAAAFSFSAAVGLVVSQVRQNPEQ